LATTHIAYEIGTGRILSVHHFEGEPEDPQNLRRTAAYDTGVAESGITVMSVQLDEIDPERRYKIDHERKALIEVPDGQGGIRFGFQMAQPPGFSFDQVRPPG
jgi:hypothetical protein